MALRICSPRNSSSASFSRCAVCEANSPYAASPAPESATNIRNATYVNPLCLPAFIAFGRAMHIEYAALLRVGRRHRHPALRLGERVLRDRAQVALRHQLLEVSRILAGVGVMLVERVAHHGEVLLQHRLLGALEAPDVVGHHHGEQERDDGEHHHQLDQRKAEVLSHLTIPGTEYGSGRLPRCASTRRTRPCPPAARPRGWHSCAAPSPRR